MIWPEKKFDDITLAEKHRCEGWNACLEACKTASESMFQETIELKKDIKAVILNAVKTLSLLQNLKNR